MPSVDTTVRYGTPSFAVEHQAGRQLMALRRRSLCAIAVVSLWVIAHDATAGAGPPITAQADRLEKSGNVAAAADLLSELAQQYPQDYHLQLRTAWLYFRAKRYTKAEGYYRNAVRLSEGSPESRLGLAWSLARGNKRRQARAIFGGLEQEQPYHPSVVLGLQLTDSRTVEFFPSFAIAYHNYANHPLKSWAAATEIRLAVSWRRQLDFAATYRFSRFFARALGSGSLGSENSDFDQHEGYATASYAAKRAGVSLHYAYLNDGSGWLPHVHVMGMTGRVTAFGDILAAGVFSLYDDINVLQGSAGWRSPALGHVSFLPEILLQHGDGDLFVSGRLTGWFSWNWLTLWAGGKYGEQLRPADLSREIVYNIPEHVLFGLWAGVGVTLGRVIDLSMGYAIDQLEIAAQPGGMRRTVAQYAGLQLAVWNLGF